MSADSHRRRFDLVELIFITGVACVMVGTATWQLAARRPVTMTYGEAQTAEEAGQLSKRYGPGHYSEHEEEWFIRDFFGDRRGGVFVDIGANHYKDASNTYYLEHVLGWSGVAVDPQREFAAGYEQHRPRTRFFPLFVGNASDQHVTFYVLGSQPLVSSVDPAFVKEFGSGARPTSVPTITLTDLLGTLKLQTMDFLSIDVELAEPQVLAGFDIDRFRPRLVCIEAHPKVRQQILDYFAAHRYVPVGKYLRLDPNNLYFRPLDQ